MSTPYNIRQQVDDLIAEGNRAEALARLRALFEDAPTLAGAAFVLSKMEALSGLTSRTSARVAFVRSFTVEPALPLLKASAALYGVDLDIRVGEFNTYAQELIGPASFLDEFAPKVVFVSAQTRDLLPDSWNGAATVPAAELLAAADRRLAEFRSYLEAFRRRSQAVLVVQNLELPSNPALGILDAQPGGSQVESIRRFNDGLRAAAAEIAGLYVLDYDGLVARHGRSRWGDEQKWLTARMPVSADCLPALAAEYLRFVLPAVGRAAKALVCDLDNTLWGGVIGEDGINGIRVDAEYPGAAFRMLQRAILDVRERGVLLAIASKNNPDDAIDAIEHHPGMLLKREHFSAVRINWNDKAKSLREIAAELNIGVDSLVFLDDNPVERQRIQAELPDVHVVPLPHDPMGYAASLRACPLFERLTLSSEDRERGRYYAEQRQRTELEQSAGTLEDFYRSLGQRMEITPLTDASLSRVAQLTQKTNQFNMTTRRYTEPEMAAIAADPRSEVYSVRIEDRFGDNGIVAVVILRYDEGGNCEIDTFLMSCRVIGRTVETAVLAQVMEAARRRGARSIWGWFLPTAKNAPSAQVYDVHGFTRIERPEQADMGEGAQAWAFDLTGALVQTPPWISLAGERQIAA